MLGVAFLGTAGCLLIGSWFNLPPYKAGPAAWRVVLGIVLIVAAVVYGAQQLLT